MQDIFHIVHILVAVGLIGLILIQHGKGADAGAAFGSGASATVFGSQGSASFLTRTTAVLATAFFISCLVLAYFSSQVKQVDSVMETVTVPAIEEKKSESDLPVLNSHTAPSDLPQVDKPATTPKEASATTEKSQSVEAPVVKTPVETNK
jgi:preprotein translocase subunit SecG